MSIPNHDLALDALRRVGLEAARTAETSRTDAARDRLLELRKQYAQLRAARTPLEAQAALEICAAVDIVHSGTLRLAVAAVNGNEFAIARLRSMA